mmetsp:Transcript_23527/g.54686  ORF Transcript_23527/g.54686 Transcript_23527/m.54686 type:complete len:94 (-) Transcript_23527:748-1029(-)
MTTWPSQLSRRYKQADLPRSLGAVRNAWLYKIHGDRKEVYSIQTRGAAFNSERVLRNSQKLSDFRKYPQIIMDIPTRCHSGTPTENGDGRGSL